MKISLVFVPLGINITETLNLLNADNSNGIHGVYLQQSMIEAKKDNGLVNSVALVASTIECLAAANTTGKVVENGIIFIPLNHKNLHEWQTHYTLGDYGNYKDVAIVVVDPLSICSYIGCATVSNLIWENMTTLNMPDKLCFEDVEHALMPHAKLEFDKNTVLGLVTSNTITMDYSFATKLCVLNCGDFKPQKNIRCKTSLPTPLIEKINWIIW